MRALRAKERIRGLGDYDSDVMHIFTPIPQKLARSAERVSTPDFDVDFGDHDDDKVTFRARRSGRSSWTTRTVIAGAT